jgi:predicted nucleic acid-binding protein
LIFVDTSALFAVIDFDDHQHRVAFAAWRGLVDAKEPLITTNYVVVELFSLAQSRLGFDAVRELENDAFPLLDVVLVDPAIHRAAVAAVFAAGRRNLSLVDCASFEVMRRRGLRTAFTLDRHFAEQGFDTVP